MMPPMKIVILVPRRADHGHRDELWAFAKAWWAKDFPDWPIVEGHHDRGAFNRSAAINRASDIADAVEPWDVAVIIDADVLIDARQVRAAVESAIETGRITIAYESRLMLSQQGTKRIMGGFRGRWEPFVLKTWPDEQSGVVVVRRDLWDEIGGFDESFQGWGWEDIAFRCAAETLGGGLDRIPGVVWHLWHPTSPENNKQLPAYQANEQRGRAFHVALGNRDAIRKLLADRVRSEPGEPTTRIPMVFHRTVPEQPDPVAEGYWQRLRDLHPGWTFHTHRDPLPPEHWPLTSDLWPKCRNGAQLAGLIRLEALYQYGGIYVDSDVEPIRSFAPLLHAPAFAAWEDNRCIPDAVLGAEPGHPAFKEALDLARDAVAGGRTAWHSGPGVTTKVLADRGDVLVLPPGAFYPFHYLDKQGKLDDAGPWAFCAHRFHGSWLDENQRASIEKRKRG
jgi:hypothetical protein